MPTKDEVLKSITKTTYSQGEVKHIINSVKGEHKYEPLSIKQGDVFVGGVKMRPHIVIKVLTDVCYAIALSSTEDNLNLDTIKQSRFLHLPDGKKMFVSKGVACFRLDIVTENFVCVYDDMKELARIMAVKKKELLELIS